QVATHRDFIATVVQNFRPKPPPLELAGSDPIGYTQARAVYEQQSNVWNNLMTGFQQQRMQAQARSEAEYGQMLGQTQRQELDSFLKVYPEYRAQKKATALRDEVLTIGPRAWGFAPRELDIQDQRWG